MAAAVVFKLSFVHLCFYVCFLNYATCLLDSCEYEVTYLTETNAAITVPVANGAENLPVFCRKGERKHPLNVWKSISVRISTDSVNYEVFQGPNCSDVVRQFKESQGFFHLLPWRSNRVELSVYNMSCIGIHSDTKFSLKLELNHIDFWKILRLLTGLFLFFAASYLSKNVVFYYSSGVILGISASLLIAVFIISRLVPRRIGAATVLFGGWAVVLYFLQLFFSNLKVIAMQHQSYVIVYLVSVGFISFVVCYRYGQVTDQRTQHLIKWGLQGIALLLVFLSTEWKEVAVSFMLIMVAIYNFPAKWSAKLRTYWRLKFPPKVRLLPEEEYHEQAAVCTRKALEELRKYCQSPECQTWRLVNRLNTPIRFAEFVNGSSHLTDDEILNYETEHSFSYNDSDEEDELNHHANTII